jgi:Cdc6-like AAA superfamily ATPase
MLPSQPKIFHGRESEVAEIVKLFSNQESIRIAILGPCGMGKTSVAKAVLHHTEITVRYEQHRHFVACDHATTKAELAALIVTHIGLKPSKDLTPQLVQHFMTRPPTLLILDNLETSWENVNSQGDIEEFLSLLTDVNHLALMVLATSFFHL